MNIEEFNKEVNICCEGCPVIALPDYAFPMYDNQERAKLAFLLGAGTALAILKAKGVDAISQADVKDFLDNNRAIESLLQKAH